MFMDFGEEIPNKEKYEHYWNSPHASIKPLSLRNISQKLKKK
jgi:hypothetical protein